MNYPGGKTNAFHQIINRIPPHKIYVEPYLGGGAIALNKKPAHVNYLLDMNQAAISIIRYRIAKSNGTEVSTEVTMTAPTNSNNGNSLGSIAVSGDAPAWRFICGDCIPWLKQQTFGPNTFIYLDPPYLFSTRRQQRPIYEFEMGQEAEHKVLLNLILNLDCHVMISGYWSELYADMLTGWYTHSYQLMTRGGAPATEYLWMNYPKPEILHDNKWFGDDYRKRESIKRKRQRRIRGLLDLNPNERLAILEGVIANINKTELEEIRKSLALPNQV